MIRGIYAGVFDLLHPGHLYALRYAMARCDHLVVAVNTDPTVDNPKKQKPLETLEERLDRLRACKYVDSILTYTGEQELQTLYRVQEYDVAFISEEHRATYTDPSPAEPVFVPRCGEHSSTKLRKKIHETS